MSQTPRELSRDFREGAVQNAAALAAGRPLLGHPVAPGPLVGSQIPSDLSDLPAGLWHLYGRGGGHCAPRMVLPNAFRLAQAVPATGSPPTSPPAVHPKPCESPGARLYPASGREPATTTGTVAQNADRERSG
jgi:hypothetical protein